MQTPLVITTGFNTLAIIGMYHTFSQRINNLEKDNIDNNIKIEIINENCNMVASSFKESIIRQINTDSSIDYIYHVLNENNTTTDVDINEKISSLDYNVDSDDVDDNDTAVNSIDSISSNNSNETVDMNTINKKPDVDDDKYSSLLRIITNLNNRVAHLEKYIQELSPKTN